MPFFLGLDITALCITVVLATALALSVLGVGLDRALNRAFALFSLMVGLWAAFSLVLRLGLWFDQGNPPLWIELATLSIGLMGPLLLIFTARYVALRSRWTDLAVSVGIAVISALTIPLFRHEVIFDPHLEPNGSTTVQLSTLGVAVAVVPAFYIVWSLVLFWRGRRRLTERYLALSVLLLMVGFVVGGVLEVPFPVLSITNTLSLLIMGYAVGNRQIFNPLRERALELQQEVAEHHRTMEALRGSEEMLRRFVEASHDGIVLVNEQGNIIAWNESQEQITGIPRAEALGQPVWNVQSWSATPEVQASGQGQAQALEDVIRGALQTGEAPWLNRIGERRLCHRDGTRRLIQSSVFPITVEKGRMLGSVSRDITEHRQVEEALQKSEERFRAIFEGASIGMSVSDSEGRLLAANPALANLIGWSLDELIGASFVEFTHPDDVEEDMRLKGRVQAGDINSYRLDKRYIHKDGRIVWVRLNISRFPGDQPQGPSTIAMIEDISGRKQAEESLRESEQVLSKTFASLHEAIFIVDAATTKIIDCNPAAQEVFGYTREEMLGRTTAFLHIDEAALEEFRRHLRSAVEEKGFLFLPEFRMKQKDGTIIATEHSVTPLEGAGGERVGWVSVVRDITERKRAEEALQRRAAQLAILNDVGQQIAAVLELDSVLHRATRLIEENFGYHHVAIFIVDRKQRKAVMRARAGSFADIFPLDHSLKLGQGMVGWVAQKGKRLLANDVLTESRYVNFYPDTIPTRCELDVPIRIGKKIVGVLDIQSPTPNDFDENDVVVMEALAGQIAAAIDNARLYESIQQELAERKRTEETLQIYAARLKTLREIDQAILAAETPQAIAQAALSRLRRLVSCERAAIVTFDFGTQQAEYLATQVNGETRLGPGVRISLETFQVEKLRQRKVQSEEDISATPERLPTHQILLEEGIRSYATVPLLSQGELVGALNLGSNQPHTFTPEQLEIVREVADQLAVGIQQAHLHEQVQRHADELEQRVAERTAELSAANEQLQALSYIKDVFVSNVSHELRTPIASLKLYLHLLNLRPEKQVSYIASLKREVERLEVLIEGLLMLSRLDQNRIEINLSPLDLNRLVRDYATDRTPLAESRKLVLVLDLKAKLPALKGDPGLLGQVLSILLTNAFSYTPEGSRVTVSTIIDNADTPQWIGFCVADTGPGISPEERFHLFERFYRGKASRESKIPGTGLGLAIAKEIVDRHQGRIEVQSDGVPGHGAKFYVWLPAQPPDDSRVIG